MNCFVLLHAYTYTCLFCAELSVHCFWTQAQDRKIKLDLLSIKLHVPKVEMWCTSYFTFSASCSNIAKTSVTVTTLNFSIVAMIFRVTYEL